MLCMREQPCLPRRRRALPADSRRGSFALVKHNAGGKSLLLPSTSARGGIARVRPRGSRLLLGPSPGAGHRSPHALLIFRTVIQLFVINLICWEVVSAGDAIPSRSQGCLAGSGTRCIRGLGGMRGNHRMGRASETLCPAAPLLMWGFSASSLALESPSSFGIAILEVLLHPDFYFNFFPY